MHTENRQSLASKISWAAVICLTLALFNITGCGRPASDSSESSSSSPANTMTPGVAGIRAEPNPVPAGEAPGKTTINWQTSDGTIGEVYLVADGAPETLFARGTNGPAEAPWIVTGSTYEFLLYAGTDHKTLLGKVTVTRAKN